MTKLKGDTNKHSVRIKLTSETNSKTSGNKHKNSKKEYLNNLVLVDIYRTGSTIAEYAHILFKHPWKHLQNLIIYGVIRQNLTKFK